MKALLCIMLLITFVPTIGINVIFDSGFINSGFVEFIKQDTIIRQQVKKYTDDVDIGDAVIRAYYKHDVDPRLILSVIKTESNYKPSAVSSAGAVGLMQVMESTAYLLQRENMISDDFNLYNIQDNVDIGTAILKYELSKFPLVEALAAYNCGHRAGVLWANNRELLPTETQEYPYKVLKHYQI